MKIGYCVLLFGIGTSSEALAVSASLTLKGNITEQTCTVSADSSDIYVDLGQWNANILNGQAGNTTENKPFKINLSDCPSSKINITFQGNSTGGSQGLLAIDSVADSAKNIAVELLNPDLTHLALNSASQSVVPNSDGKASFTFYARYISLASAVTPGKANANSTFVFAYN